MPASCKRSGHFRFAKQCWIAFWKKGWINQKQQSNQKNGDYAPMLHCSVNASEHVSETPTPTFRPSFLHHTQRTRHHHRSATQHHTKGEGFLRGEIERKSSTPEREWEREHPAEMLAKQPAEKLQQMRERASSFQSNEGIAMGIEREAYPFQLFKHLHHRFVLAKILWAGVFGREG